MPAVPVVTTERLTLDAFSDAESARWAAILAEPDAGKEHQCPRLLTGEVPRRRPGDRIGWHNAGWGERGYGVWAVRGASDGCDVGGGCWSGGGGLVVLDIGEATGRPGTGLGAVVLGRAASPKRWCARAMGWWCC